MPDATVTRDVPAKRAIVNEGHTVILPTGEVYHEGDVFDHPDGPTVDSLELMGMVMILSHDVSEEFDD